MAETTLYLFDGYNLLHAGEFTDPAELVDLLASYVAHRGARGVVVFDGHGADRDLGPLAVRTRRMRTTSSSASRRRTATASPCSSSPPTVAVRGTAGQEVRKTGSRAFLAELEPVRHTTTSSPGPADAWATGSTPRRASGSTPPTRRGLETPRPPLIATAEVSLGRERGATRRAGEPAPATARARGGEPLEPGRQVPVPRAQELHRRGQEHGPDDRRVDEDRRGEADPISFMSTMSISANTPKTNHHDRSAGDDAGRRLDPLRDRVLGVEAAVVVLADALRMNTW